MPIAQLQAETARATGVYTWATKPSAVGNSGLRIRISDISNTEWESDGSFWRAANGVAHVSLNCAGVQTTLATLGAVAGIPALSLPLKDFLLTPGFSCWADISANRESPGTTQSSQLRMVAGGVVNLALLINSVVSHPTLQSAGQVRRYSDTQVMQAAQSAQPNQSYPGSTLVNLSSLASGMVPIEVWYQSGATDNSEVATFGSGSVTLRF